MLLIKKNHKNPPGTLIKKGQKSTPQYCGAFFMAKNA
jgi:hypothetical protein